MTVFLGVYRALYDYEPQTSEELAIKENDLLYLLEKSQVDDWWTVKKRVIGSDAEEPVGLVPANYIEEAPVIKQVKALYDYGEPQNPDEELAFREGDSFDVFDDKDQDWLLVKSVAGSEYGFVPGNYVEVVPAPAGAGAAAPVAAAAAVPAAGPGPSAPTVQVSNFEPPPQHVGRAKVAQAQESTDMSAPGSLMAAGRTIGRVDEEGTPPPTPARPAQQSTAPESSRDRARSRVSYMDTNDNDYGYDDRYDGGNGVERDHDRDRYREREREEYRRHRPDDNYYDDYDSREANYHSWNVQEIDGRKRRKAKLVVGNNKVNFIPQKGEQQEWRIDKLVSYDNEKKHVFLEFVDPYRNLELHVNSNDTSKEIMALLGEMKGASRRDTGLHEIEMASRPKRQGKVLYDFIGESPDELTIKEGDLVYIIDNRKSRDWWLCELVSNHRRGVVPAQFVEPLSPASTGGGVGGGKRGSGGLLGSLKKMTRSGSKKNLNKATHAGGDNDDSYGSWRDDVGQDISGREKGRKRLSSFGSRRKRSSSVGAAANASRDDGNEKTYPNPKKTRLWIDRSGTFKVDAQFIGCAEGKIHLHKVNGVKIAVAAEKLSDDDLTYVERVTGFSLERYKSSAARRRDEGTSGDVREAERERRRRLREQEERERDRRLRERELAELKKARLLLDEERAKLAQEKELPPIKPPRPTSVAVAPSSSASKRNVKGYDWFEFFLNCGVDVNNCQRYTINFDREQITEDMMGDINSSMLRTLGLREGDIVRVMKFLDNKFGRGGNQDSQTGAGNMFSEPNGALKTDGAAVTQQAGVTNKLLSQKTAPPEISTTMEDDAWTSRPAARSQPNLVGKSSEFTGSMQDLLDLEPLEPKKAVPSATTVTPEPNLKDLQPVKSSGSTAAPSTSNTSNLVPLDPFKTGGNNVLPFSTGFVMMPFTTGGLMSMPQSGVSGMPVSTFNTQSTGNLLQRTNTGGLIPIGVATTGGPMPQTTFGMQPVNTGLLPLQSTGGLLPVATTGGPMPQTTFGTTVTTTTTTTSLPPSGSVLPVQKTGSGLMPVNVTGGAIPQTTFMTQSLTGGAMPQTTFGAPATTVPSTTFGAPLSTGQLPQTTFGMQPTAPVASVGLPQTSFNTAVQPATNVIIPQQRTGGFQPHSQFGMALQRTGGMAVTAPSLTGGAMTGQLQPGLPAATTFNTGVGGITTGLQNTFITQPQQLQTQPTGFGFGNGPQVAQQPIKQANIFNATADNPFGFQQ